mmetsp:Transcript_43940/g.99291  ORF Transcript_43940/g.99291 Transcript_43940/m.99291 type:complete len:125 (+) Transcript_43940:247-621(+)
MNRALGVLPVFSPQLALRMSIPLQLYARNFASKIYGASKKKRMPLSPKRARKGFYKGNGCRSEGRHTSKGGFVMDKEKLLELVVPDMSGFKLMPYVANATPKQKYPLAADLYREMANKSAQSAQ